VITARERELVLEVLDSRQLSLGPMLARFERDWAERIGVPHAVACSSGTAGLHMCLHAAGVGPGDEVITSSFSFVASANAVLFTGADVVFAEVDPQTFNMDPAAVEAAITPRTKALVIVDIFGYPAEIPALIDVADRHGLAKMRARQSTATMAARSSGPGATRRCTASTRTSSSRPQKGA
jgi:perosamine synthetase